MSDSPATVRLAKLIAARGLASRRKAEELVFEGHVTVNGELVEHPATMVSPVHDLVEIDGVAVPDEPDKVYYLVYKPKGYITGREDPHGRKSVIELVEHLPFRMEPVGRLDYDTEGALLFTNDGDLAHALTHPSRGVPKRYRAKVYRTPSPGTLKAIEQGRVYLDDGRVQPSKVRVDGATDRNNAWVEITVTEGRNRLIRRIFAQMGHPVSKLRRESFATLSIRGMERGDVRVLTGDEVQRLQDIGAGVKPKQAGRVKRKAGFAKPKPRTRRSSSRRKKPSRA